ncbi:MAG: YbaB/EbfC family nucleoid-associated protein [Deltaproteobacteria bacterium]|nr:YbaB/EbfC family nucleoid-associated protein [Deltaproteobacteria bacterium]
MKQAQQMQERLAQIQTEAGDKTVSATAGGGMVSAVVNGRLEVVSLQIDKQVAAGGDLEMLQDLVIAAVNQGIRAAQQMMAAEMSKVTGGLKIPGLT